MKLHQQSSQAFTLIESVVVMGVVAMFILLPLINFTNVSTKMEEDLFIEDLSSSLTLMQNHAILNGQTTSVTIIPNENRIHFNVLQLDQHPLEHSVHFPDSVKVLNNAQIFKFQRDTGNYGSFQTLRFDTSQGWVEFVFQLGSGRFYVRKVEG